jgi:hypothetical protein
MYLPRVRSDSVWQSLKVVFLGALLIFLINNWFGFDNALTAGAIDRWQILIHLHAGSVGWITLSAIGIAIWLYTGDRTVDAAYERQVRTLAWVAAVVFALYVIAFGLSWSTSTRWMLYLHPIVGVVAVLILWYAALWSFGQMRQQTPLTTVHVLASGALLTASIGATVGMLLGLEHAIGPFLPLPEGDRVGAHAGMMDTYLFLVASAVIEWVHRKEAQRWSWPGLAQAVLWMLAAALVPTAYFLNILNQVLPIFGLLLLASMIIFLVRYGWRALISLPTGAGMKSWAFFGTLSMAIYLGLFLFLVMNAAGGDFSGVPSWYFAVFAHVGFVGMMTNLLMGVAASRAQAAAGYLPWGEPAALWTINLGLVAFLGLKIAADIRLGAIVMGLGVLLGVVVMSLRLLRTQGQRAETESGARPQTATP